jgi:hypothetical protein
MSETELVQRVEKLEHAHRRWIGGGKGVRYLSPHLFPPRCGTPGARKKVPGTCEKISIRPVIHNVYY